MIASPRARIALLAACALLYAAAFVPANLTGSDDVNMLSAFFIDEFGQFHVLLRMTEPASSLGEALLQVVAYDHYYYGFPFFLTGAATFLPLRWIYTTLGEPGLTQATMLVLRQQSAWFMLAGIGLLVHGWTRFRSLPRALALGAFLALIPAVVRNNLWWHPEGLATAFVAGTIVCLANDRGRLGRWFDAAAVCCGLAAATKLIGLWFAPAVLLHLLRRRPELGWTRLAARGAAFTALMALTIVAANPQLLVPGEAAEVVATLGEQTGMNAFGWGTRGDAGPLGWYGTLRGGFGFWWLHALLLAICAVTIRSDPEHRELAIQILAWVVPFSVYMIFGVANQAERYFLPVLVPLASCLGSPEPWRRIARIGRPARRAATATACALPLAVQTGVFLREDVQRYAHVLSRVERSPSLEFHRELEARVLGRLGPDVRLRLLQDPGVYVAPRPHYDVHLRWRGLDHGDVAQADPDLILLRRFQIDRWRDPEVVALSYDPEQAARSQRFYRDAFADELDGYHQLLATDFAVAFGRTANRR